MERQTVGFLLFEIEHASGQSRGWKGKKDEGRREEKKNKDKRKQGRRGKVSEEIKIRIRKNNRKTNGK